MTEVNRITRFSAYAALVLCLFARLAPAADTPTGPEILQSLRSFDSMGTVLHIAAHPDDENTQLITYLSRGRNYRMAYLSVTRGDGGQNLLGAEFFEQLGVIRTQELLAARRLDGGRQFFTRAKDFGYSKHVAETLRIWDEKELTGDVVRVIRTFRPDVIITRFNPDTDNTHGHHTASAVLGRAAFKLAGDPNAYPEQVAELGVWQPKRILLNGFGGGNGAISVDVSGNDPVTGESFASIANRSRAMHKSQFGTGGGGGGRGGAGGRGGGGGGPQPQSFTLLGGEPATQDIMDGVDTTWNRVAGGGEIAKLTDDAIAKFKPEDSAASVPALLAIKKSLAALPADRILDEKRDLIDRIIQNCLGLSVQTTIASAEIVPGEKIRMHHNLTMHADTPLRLTAVRFPAVKDESKLNLALHANQQTVTDSVETLPANTPVSQPYWLREEGTVGIFRVDQANLIGQPENPPVFPVEFVFDLNGQSLVIRDEPVEVTSDKLRRLDVIPPVALQFASEVRLFSPGASKTVEIEVDAFRPDINGALQLDAPAGWKIDPPSQPMHLAKINDKAKFVFNATAPNQATAGKFGATATIGGAKFSSQRIIIEYPHIPLELLQPPAQEKAVAMDLKIRGQNIGYLPGAGDNVAECIEQMGYKVTQLTGADLNLLKLKDFDAVVLGIRAFESRTDLAPNLDGLFSYVEFGGTLITQYNRADVNRQQPGTFGPLKLQQSQQRVTDETARMTFLAPDHPVLNTPNKITAADFDGWVQERGIYYPSAWDEKFKPILAANDPDEQPLNGGLLVADYGKGHVVYTGLVFFRELPEGVPGAYRLFANLLSLGR